MNELSSSPQNIPQKALASLDPQRSDYYVVKEGLIYNYYSIKVEPFEQDQNIIRFEKYPPIIVEGVAMLKKRLFRVTPEDLLRGIIRKSREIVKRNKVKEITNVGTTNSAGDIIVSGPIDASTEADISLSTSPTVQAAVQHQDEQSAFGLAILEESELADISWQEQIGALQDLVSEKERGEWEVSDTL